MFKGAVTDGTAMTVQFLSDHSNSGSAHVLVTHGKSGGGSNIETDTVAPGGSSTIKMPLNGRGMFSVMIDMALDSDKGWLIVTADTKPLPTSNGSILGDTRWTYSVVKKSPASKKKGQPK